MDQTQLTPRQRDVVTEMCKGKSNKEIARALGMAEATVKLHLTEVFKTIGVKTRYEAIAKASGFPITTPDPPLPITDLQIMEDFANTAFDTLNNTWADRVLRFGYAIENRSKGKNK